MRKTRSDQGIHVGGISLIDQAKKAARQLEQALSEEERERLIRTHVTSNPNKPGIAEAWIHPEHVSVWAIVSYLEAVHGDLEQAAHDYDLPLDAVKAAVAYFSRHQSVIAAHIEANEPISSASRD